MGDATAKTIADSLRGNSTVLRVLYISTNNIGPEGGVAIGEMMRVNVEMQDLNIASNHIGDAGAVAIAGALKVNPSVYKLSLRLNEIRESMKIVRQVLEKMPKGDYRVQDKKVTPPPRARIDVRQRQHPRK